MQSIQFLIIDSILYGILAWYLNRVIRPEYGQALPLWFPFTRTYWCPSTTHPVITEIDLLERDAQSSIPFETVGENLRRQAEEGKGIEIHSLRKVFDKVIAVDNLNLSMFSGQITALLGHNGTSIFPVVCNNRRRLASHGIFFFSLLQ
jgi:hypothetical protein